MELCRAGSGGSRGNLGLRRQGVGINAIALPATGGNSILGDFVATQARVRIGKRVVAGIGRKMVGADKPICAKIMWLERPIL